MGLFSFIGDAFKAVNPLNLIGDVVGGAANVASTAMTNHANKELAAEQNQWNVEQWQREADFNREMWRANNEYNDPSAQMKRLTDAGLSPWAAASALGAGAGNATATTAPAGMQASTPQMQAPNFSFMGDALQRQFDNYLRNEENTANVRKTNAEADKAESEAEMTRLYKDEYWRKIQDENLIGLMHDNRGKTYDSALKMQALEHNSGNFMLDSFLKRQQMRLNDYRMDYSQLENIGMSIDNKIKQLNLQWLPYQVRASLALSAAQTFAANMAGNLSKEQTEHELYKKYATILNSSDVHNANEVALQLSKINLGNVAMDYQWNAKYNDLDNQPNGLWYRLNDISKGIGHLLGNGVAPLLKFLK